MKLKLYEGGREKYGRGQIIGENILVLLNVSVAMYAMWDVKLFEIPIATLIYGAFVTFMLLIFLRKNLCTHCYYYGKTCHCGWSKLAKFYKKQSGNLAIAKKAAGVTWGVLTALPVLVTLILAVVDYRLERIIVLLILIVFLILQGLIHKKNCDTCKMRYSCPGNAYKA